MDTLTYIPTWSKQTFVTVELPVLHCVVSNCGYTLSGVADRCTCQVNVVYH